MNLNRIQYWLTANRLDASAPITLRELASSRCIHGCAADGVKLLARGKSELTTPIHIIVSRASAAAIAAVEAVGGTVTTRYYTRFAVDKIRKGEMDAVNSLQSRIAHAPETEEGAEAVGDGILEGRGMYRFRLPDPSSRKDIEYYRDEAHRGYLSHQVKEGAGPSLFFKTPGLGGDGKRKREGKGKGGKKGSASGERLW